jgi:hypothetical protein
MSRRWSSGVSTYAIPISLACLRGPIRRPGRYHELNLTPSLCGKDVSSASPLTRLSDFSGTVSGTECYPDSLHDERDDSDEQVTTQNSKAEGSST